MNYLRKKNSQFKPINIVRREDEPIVQDGLSVTPAEVADMVSRGIPVSTGNLKALEVYKMSDNDFDVPLEMCRHVDVADMYQFNREVHSKVKSAVQQHIDSSLNQKGVENARE